MSHAEPTNHHALGSDGEEQSGAGDERGSHSHDLRSDHRRRRAPVDWRSRLWMVPLVIIAVALAVVLLALVLSPVL